MNSDVDSPSQKKKKRVKFSEYGPKLAACRNKELIPFIVDAFAAQGDALGPFLGRLAKDYAKRFGSFREGRQLFFANLNLGVTVAVATLALASG